jgi:hypothetical protein
MESLHQKCLYLPKGQITVHDVYYAVGNYLVAVHIKDCNTIMTETMTTPLIMRIPRLKYIKLLFRTRGQVFQLAFLKCDLKNKHHERFYD